MNVLAIGCHPDDLEIGCYGTLAKYVKLGHNVSVCHLANGNLGHVEIMPDELRAMRFEEAENAAKVIGAKHYSVDANDLYVTAEDDGLVNPPGRRGTGSAAGSDHYPLRSRLHERPYADLLRRPARLLRRQPGPLRPERHHAHRARVPHLSHGPGGRHGLYSTEYVDITDTIDLKLEALACHKSQIVWMRDHGPHRLFGVCAHLFARARLPVRRGLCRRLPPQPQLSAHDDQAASAVSTVASRKIKIPDGKER